MSRNFVLTLVALLVGAGTLSGIAYRRLHVEHDRLAAQLTALRLQAAGKERWLAENVRMKEVIELGRRDRREATAAVRSDVSRVQREIAELEQKAGAEHETINRQSRERTEALEANRDLAKGPVLIENCTDVGRATPENALQTLIWAAAQGHDDMVQLTLKFDGAARTLAEAAIATLPEASRAKYPTPESLGALFIGQVVNDLTGIRVINRSVTGGEATLNVGGLQKPIGSIALKQNADGWQVVIDAAVFKKIERMLLSPPKK